MIIRYPQIQLIAIYCMFEVWRWCNVMTILVTECETGEWCAVSSVRGRVGTYLSDSFTGHVSFDGGLDNTNCGYTGYMAYTSYYGSS